MGGETEGLIERTNRMLGEMMTAEQRAAIDQETATCNRPAAIVPDDLPAEVRIKRASAYLSRLPESVQGNNGSAALYRAASAMWNGFALSDAETFTILANEFNPRCAPPWGEAEIRHKVNDAASKPHNRPRGYLFETGDDRQVGAMQLDPTAADLFGGKPSAEGAGAEQVPATVRASAAGQVKRAGVIDRVEIQVDTNESGVIANVLRTLGRRHDNLFARSGKLCYVDNLQAR